LKGGGTVLKKLRFHLCHTLAEQNDKSVDLL